MKKRVLLLGVILLLTRWICWADEGMWIPMLLKKYNIEDMQKKGFKLSAEDIYAINQASLKDAVIGLGREGRPFFHFCTGNLVSDEGLVITNHHCSFDMIQQHSSLEHNYLRDGFWAKSREEELANPGITASILVRMEDVTEKILSHLEEDMSEQEREKKIREISARLEKEAVAGTNLQANIKPYFNGNQFFMSVFKIYRDVRLVGAPPSAIGKFGGDTDNWMWPRHTGDFSVLRIYADENNEPAGYSPKNQPYRPDRFFKVSVKGVKEGDFTMVFGYPGTTNEYLTSYAIEQIQQVENPHKVAIRTAKLNIMNAAMESDEWLRIKYASKAAGVANAWKKWQGEIKGLERFNTIQQKQKLETEFQAWAENRREYKDLLSQYEKLYGQRKELTLAYVYLNEAGKQGAEIIGFATKVHRMLQAENKENRETLIAKIKEAGREFYKDYDEATDRKILAEMLKLYNRNLPEEWIPEKVKRAAKENDYPSFVRNVFNKSVFSDSSRLFSLLDHPNEALQKIKKDPAYLLGNSMDVFYVENIYPKSQMIEKSIQDLNRLWLKGIMEMQPEKNFYADANSTLRVAYGKIEGYSPVDAVYYKHYSTLKGIIEKDNPAIYDYDVPQKLRDLYAAKDFGRYAQEEEMPVCFLASNHTTGGNSGSPVLNAEGELIGLNFDRAWEGVMSDLQYNPEICRNISVDIRYVLFIIDKFAGAGHLIEEMEIVKD